MNNDFLNAAYEIFSNPIVDVVVGGALLVGLWKGAKALAQSAQEEKQRDAEIEESIAELRRVVTPLDPARLGIKSTHQP